MSPEFRAWRWLHAKLAPVPVWPVVDRSAGQRKSLVILRLAGDWQSGGSVHQRLTTRIRLEARVPAPQDAKGAGDNWSEAGELLANAIAVLQDSRGDTDRPAGIVPVHLVAVSEGTDAFDDRAQVYRRFADLELRG